MLRGLRRARRCPDRRHRERQVARHVVAAAAARHVRRRRPRTASARARGGARRTASRRRAASTGRRAAPTHFGASCSGSSGPSVGEHRRDRRDHAAGVVGLAEVDRERGVADRLLVGSGDHRDGRRHVLGEAGLVEHDVERVAIADDLRCPRRARRAASAPSCRAARRARAGGRLATTWPAPISSPLASVTLVILPHDTPSSVTLPARTSPPAVVSFSTSSSRIASPSPRSEAGPVRHASTARAIAAGGARGGAARSPRAAATAREPDRASRVVPPRGARPARACSASLASSRRSKKPTPGNACSLASIGSSSRAISRRASQRASHAVAGGADLALELGRRADRRRGRCGGRARRAARRSCGSRSLRRSASSACSSLSTRSPAEPGTVGQRRRLDRQLVRPERVARRAIVAEHERAQAAARAQRGAHERGEIVAEDDQVVRVTRHGSTHVPTLARQPTRRQAPDDARAAARCSSRWIRACSAAASSSSATGDRGLRDDRPAVEARVDEVHRDARELHAVRDRLRRRVDAGERRQQRRVRVDDAQRERVDEVRGEHAHEAGEHDRLDAVRARAPRAARSSNASRGERRVIDDARRACPPRAARARAGASGLVRDHDRDRRGRELAARLRRRAAPAGWCPLPETRTPTFMR